MWIKICANTNLEDTMLAIKLGADAVGFVFAPSPRQVVTSQAAEIVTRLPASVEKVGVFPHWPAERILQAVHHAKLTGVQLHGGIDARLARILHAELQGRVTLIQVLHWDLSGGGPQVTSLRSQVQEAAAMPEIDRILIDSKVGSAAGGTGVTFPWQDAKNLFVDHPKLILAGGLNPDNVGDCVRLLKPWGVDVASGVEITPGRKDPLKLERFIQAVRESRTVHAAPIADAVERS